jgi:uncharacterized tellurite resistance protein B-like protein
MDEMEPDIDARVAAVIAAGMQAVALADGDEHPRELEMIASFRAELPEGVDASDMVLTDPAHRHVYVRSLVTVALADGRLSEVERHTVVELAHAHGISLEEVQRAVAEVSRDFLGSFRGVHVFRDQALALAESLGIGREEAEGLLE